MGISVFGAGTLGARVLAGTSGVRRAITRTEARWAQLRALGAIPTLDWPTPGRDDLVVLALPGSAAQAEAIARLAGSRPDRAVLVSTTGYHAPYAGEVSAGSPPGASARAQEAAETEAAFRDWMGDRGTIVRLGGLYTATRGPAAHFARTLQVRPGPADAPLPLVHYDDAATLVIRALERPAPPVVIGVTAVPTREAFYTTVAAHLGVPVPPLGPAAGAVAFDLRTCRELLPDPAQPDWRAHLPPAS
ncbi:MAG: hypothetical protein KC656_11340 [Myxococcales bacterium]|nr:hypothetical protein [Myxococcales bacterium]MCB9669681.1 hypothetical protein [Alphaproteobacteria bacterium]MCB9672791.1 hypothetical protein [Alphaproteobacteria bacterium]MCB9694719.1 hypothetical protein [Alphaproteobacteria bacterium]